MIPPPVVPGSFPSTLPQSGYTPQSERGRSYTRSFTRCPSCSASPCDETPLGFGRNSGIAPIPGSTFRPQLQHPGVTVYPHATPTPVGEIVKTTQGHVYNIQEQIWSDDQGQWLAYDAPPPPDYEGAIFIVYHRRQKRKYGRQRREETDLFTDVRILDQRLTKALRDMCKDVEELFGRAPQFALSKLYPYAEDIGTHMKELEEAEHDAETVKMLRSFLELFQAEYAPHKEKFETLIKEGKITSEFLWAIFKPGTRVRTTHHLTKDIVGAVIDSVTAVSGLGAEFRMNGRTLNWNGTEFEHCMWTYSLPYLWEPRSLTDLPVAVLTDEELGYLKDRGRKYTEFAGVKHVHVKGTFYGAIQRKIDDRCMLDTLTYRSGRVPQCPGTWFPQPIRSSTAVSRAAPSLPVHSSTSTYAPQIPRMQSMQTHQPTMQCMGCMECTQQYQERAVGHPNIQDELDNENTFKSMKTVPDNLLWLLPPVLFGFDFGSKAWGQFYIQEIEPAQYEDKIWDRLVLSPDIKIIIRSIVDACVKPNATAMINDWVKGKGGGLVVLLHGVAGVGKTLTAEAVAELLHRPLYTVGSGELGSMAHEVEPALKSHLDLATSWNAVLLIDEADVFLAKRGIADIFRNALVATFLRLLEYHAGMLFLTTNRVKAFDESFLSRVSVAIKYQKLDIQQRGQIWKQFFQFILEQKTEGKGGDIDSALLTDECLSELAMKPFNGRVIKNIVRTAQSLAISSEEPLGMCHIRTVTDITEKFIVDTVSVRNNDGADPWAHDPEDEVVSLY